MGGDLTEAIRFDRHFHDAANRFLSTLGALTHQALIYEADNKTLQELFERLMRDLKSVFELTPVFKFRGQDRNIFVNDERLRCDSATFVKHQQFLEELSARKMGGIVFHTQPELAEWQGAITLITKSKPDSPTPFQDIRQSFQESGLWDKIELLPHQGVVHLVNLLDRHEKRTTAVHAYAKTLSLFRLYMENIEDANRLGYYHLKLWRSVQDLAGACQEGGWKYLGLVNNKTLEEYRYSHPTSTALLALVLGVRLNLRRARLSELGMTAILHDLGKSALPQALMEKQGAFTPEERETFNQHPRLAVRVLLRTRQYNESLLKRITVLYEHHKPPQEGQELHPYSRIVAIAEQFDALSSPRAYRSAVLPDDAVRHVVSIGGKRLDRDLVRLFVQTIGLYPCGTVLELSTGEKAISLGTSDATRWKTPTVRIIRSQDGKDLLPSVDLDLADQSFATKRSVVRTLDAAEVMVNVPGYLYQNVSTEGLTQE